MHNVSQMNLLDKVVTAVKISLPFAKKKQLEVHRPDLIFYILLKIVAYGVLFLFCTLVYYLYQASVPALQEFGWRFFFTNAWNPVTNKYGALAFIYGTVISSLLALIIAVPISVGAALFLTELSPKFLKAPVGFLVEMLAAIPSVVYGLWGIFMLAPMVRVWLEPLLAKYLGFLPLFQGPPLGVGMLTSGIVLAIMIIPTITAISREVFRSIPDILREGALALGATRWEMIKLAVLKTGTSGVIGAIILGLGRALGETMAVTMVIGNKAQIAASVFEPAATMASVIANEYAEANHELHLAALAAIGFALFFVSLIVNGLARLIIWRVERRF